MNAAYIASATVDDNLRGEQSFLLQGSYRNIARLAQRILPAMTTAEVDTLVADHYQAESQTLATEAGWNLARLGEVPGTQTPDEAAYLAQLHERWRESNVADPVAVIANALQGIESSLRHPAELKIWAGSLSDTERNPAQIL